MNQERSVKAKKLPQTMYKNVISELLLHYLQNKII